MDPLVAQNRQKYFQKEGVESERVVVGGITHGTSVRSVGEAQAGQYLLDSDALITNASNLFLSIIAADCLPVFFYDPVSQSAGIAHAGWRGLAGGVLESTLDALAVAPEALLVWLGPAIGPAAFEVGPEVRAAFLEAHPSAEQAFVASRNPGRFMADLYRLARIRLAARGVEAVYGGGFCTYRDPRFYSYRREPRTGRFASLVWLEAR